MGTQQILLIVLSVIIVGVAIAVGIQMFNSQSYSSNKSAIAADAQSFAAQVVQWYKTPVSQGGAGNTMNKTGESLYTAGDIASFIGWESATEEDDSTTGETSNENGDYEITNITATAVQAVDKDFQHLNGQK